jgi:hypothetical protein
LFRCLCFCTYYNTSVFSFEHPIHMYIFTYIHVYLQTSFIHSSCQLAAPFPLRAFRFCMDPARVSQICDSLIQSICPPFFYEWGDCMSHHTLVGSIMIVPLFSALRP